MDDNQKENRPMFDVTCSECGAATQVPFEPTGSRPVYCYDCFQKRKATGGDGPRRSDRPMFDAVCAECGQATQVPFQPTGNRPVYCQSCFAKKRD